MTTASLFNTILQQLISPGPFRLSTEISDDIAFWAHDPRTPNDPALISNIVIENGESVLTENDISTVTFFGPNGKEEFTSQEVLATTKKSKFSLPGMLYALHCHHYQSVLSPSEVFEKSVEWVHEFNRRAKTVDETVSFDFFCDGPMLNDAFGGKLPWMMRASMFVHLGAQLVQMYPD